MAKKCIFILMLLLSSLAFAGEGKVVGVVFHDSYCEAIPEARQSYLDAVKGKGFTLIDLCVSTRSASKLKMDIEAEAEKENIKWSDIDGINIVGPVVDTLVLPSVSGSFKKPVPSVVGLMFDNFEFSYNNSYLTGVNSGYFMPSKIRWVSQLFARGQASWGEIVKKLSEAETQLVSVGEAGCGERFSDGVLAGLNERRVRVTDNWSAFPDGIGWNLMAYAFTVGAWYVTGASREMYGYSPVNRLQTATDKFMYLFIIYPGFALINLYSTYNLVDHLFGRSLPNDDQGWKKYVLNKRLEVDGLAGQAFCRENKWKAS